IADPPETQKAPAGAFIERFSPSLALVFALLLGLLVVAHQAALLIHLTIREGVLIALIGVIAALELDTDRRTDQLKHAAVGVFQVADIGLGYRLDLVAVNHDQRRVGTTQVGIAQLDAAIVDHGRRMIADGVFKNRGQTVGGPAGDRRLERGLHRLVQVTHAGAMQRRDKVDIGKVDEEQPALQLDLHVIALARLHAVPFVQGNHQSAAAFQHEAEQVKVMIDHTFAGIHDEYHDVGVLDRLQGFHHRELFHRLKDLAATTYASGINQGVLLVIALERDVDTIAGGTGLVIHDDSFFTEHAVDQGRLADVGTADDRQLDTVLLARARNALSFLT